MSVCVWEKKHLQWESGISWITSSMWRGPHQRCTQKPDWHGESRMGFQSRGRKRKTSYPSLPFFPCLTHFLSLPWCLWDYKGSNTWTPYLSAAVSHKECAACVRLMCVRCLCSWMRWKELQPAYLTYCPTWVSLNAAQLYGGPFSDQWLAWNVWSHSLRGYLMKPVMLARGKTHVVC